MREAIRRIEADYQRCSDTHLIPVSLPSFAVVCRRLASFAGVALYLKDESSHPTGSLKHRLARSLFLHALCNVWRHETSTVVETSSGSTAVSEAYFARLLGLPFIAVMPRGTSPQKLTAIEFHGGSCRLGGRPASDLRRKPAPGRRAAWPLHGPVHLLRARYRLARQQQHRRKHLQAGDLTLTLAQSSRIEGIGRPRVEASFVPGVLDAMVQVPDLWSLAAMHALSVRLGRRVGGSTGTKLIASLACMRSMQRRGLQGAIVTLLCDGDER